MDENVTLVLEGNGTQADTSFVVDAPQGVVPDTSLSDELGSKVDEVGNKVDEGFDGLDHKLFVLKRGQTELKTMLNETMEGGEDGNVTQVVEIEGNQLREFQAHMQRIGDIGSVSLYLSLVCTLIVAALLGSFLWSAFSKGWRK